MTASKNLEGWVFGKRCNSRQSTIHTTRSRGSNRLFIFNYMKFFPVLLSVVIFYSCKHHAKSDEDLKKFDSVNQSLKAANEKVEATTSSISDSLGGKFNEVRVTILHQAIADCKSYLEELQRRFKIFCGDSTGVTIPINNEDKISLSNRFFETNDKEGRHLLSQLEAVQQVCLLYTSDAALKKQIKNLTAVPEAKKDKDFMKLYFYDVPSVAVITILSKFENDIINIENKILHEHLNR